MRHRAPRLAAAFMVTLVGAAAAVLGACNRPAGLELSLLLALDCDEARLVDIVALRFDVAPCATPGCAIADSTAFLTGAAGQTVLVEPADLSPMAPLQVLIRDVSGMTGTWLAVFATALDTDANPVASGRIDVEITRGGLLRATEPLTLGVGVCGYAPEPDWDLDGWVGEDDCQPFFGGVNAGVPEDCTNLADDDCDGAIDLEDTDCLNPDADDDGVCAKGVSEVFSMRGQPVPQWILDLCPNGFSDCNDDDATTTHCACDADEDGYCACADENGDGVCDNSNPYLCPHWQARLGLSIVCAPGGDCCDSTQNSSCAFVNPAQVEVCDSIDNDCDGLVDVGSVGAAACFAYTVASTCEEGVYCVGATGEPGLCHALGYDPSSTPPAAICEGNGIVMPYCTMTGIGGTTGTVCGDAGVTVTLDPFDPTATGCSVDVVMPTAPLAATVTMSGCTGAPVVLVDTSAVTVTATYDLYLEVTFDTPGGSVTSVLHLRIPVYAGCTDGMPVAWSCTSG